MTVLAITGTSTDVGKTIVTAALAAAATAANISVAVCKAAQTGVADGEPGDAHEVARLAGIDTIYEGTRYPEPLAPETAAARSGISPITLPDITALVAHASLANLVLLEGAGGVLVRLGPDLTIVDAAAALDAPVLVVAQEGLGSLNHTELTVNAIRHRGLRVAGIAIGSADAEPDLASRTNRDDLPRLTGIDIVASIPAGAGKLPPGQFQKQAPGWFGSEWVTTLTDL